MSNDECIEDSVESANVSIDEELSKVSRNPKKVKLVQILIRTSQIIPS